MFLSLNSLYGDDYASSLSMIGCDHRPGRQPRSRQRKTPFLLFTLEACAFATAETRFDALIMNRSEMQASQD